MILGFFYGFCVVFTLQMFRWSTKNLNHEIRGLLLREWVVSLIPVINLMAALVMVDLWWRATHEN